MDLNTFAANCKSQEPVLLRDLRLATWQQTRHGRLMSDVQTGRTVAMVSRMIRPTMAIELGTFTGYGTLCLLEGLDPNGELHTIERNDELFAIQDRFWSRAEGHQRIRRHHANVVNVLQSWNTRTSGQIDLAYVDADKQGTMDHLEGLLPLMAQGAWMLFDNTWWGGTLWGPNAATGPKPDALRALHKRIEKDPSLHAITFPVGDGLTAVQKR